MDDYALAVGVATAMLAFLLAATFIGAEWSSKNLVAWLFWEPRRLRVMAAKLLALLDLGAGARGAGPGSCGSAPPSCCCTTGACRCPRWARGPRTSGRTWSTPSSGRRPLVLITALIGFSLASLMRNSAAALGVAFVYFAVVENVIRGLNPDLQPYLFTTNLAAWIANSGITVYGKQVYDQRQGYVLPKEIHLSNVHGA